MSSSLQSVWQDAIRQLKQNPQVGQADLAFVRMSKPLTTYENTIIIATPNNYSKSIIETRLAPFYGNHFLQLPLATSFWRFR